MASRAPNTARARRASAPKEQKPRPWTRADLTRLPDDGNRYEVLDGCLLVTPQASHDHQGVATRLVIVLEQYVARNGVAHVVGPGAVPFKKNELQPDVQVIPGPMRPGSWGEFPTPILVVEVLSTSTSHRDFGVKLDAYLERLRVPTVWIVDYKQREVHVAQPGVPARVERQTLTWQAPGAPKPLIIDLPAFFVNAFGG